MTMATRSKVRLVTLSPCHLVTLSVFLAGCGTSYAPVSGRVTLDGKPLEGAIVTFQPAADNPNRGTGSVGNTDEDGRFTLRVVDPSTPGAVPGKHVVLITLYEKGDGKPGAEKSGTQLLPVRYNEQTTLTCTVPPGGTTEANFDLTKP
jgi:hypothetical protein